jgi:hypothetical protein
LKPIAMIANSTCRNSSSTNTDMRVSFSDGEWSKR